MKKNGGMGKEIIIAIICGLIIALTITTVLYWRSAASNPQINLSLTSPIPTPTTALPEKTPPPIEFLDLEDESVFDNKALTVKGLTFPNTEVVIFNNDKNFITKSDDTGLFSLELNLESGSNNLEAIVIDQNGQDYSTSRLVIYTNKSLEEILITDQELLQEATTGTN